MLECFLIGLFMGLFAGVSLMCIFQIDKETYSYEEEKKSDKDKKNTRRKK